MVCIKKHATLADSHRVVEEQSTMLQKECKNGLNQDVLAEDEDFYLCCNL